VRLDKELTKLRPVRSIVVLIKKSISISLSTVIYANANRRLATLLKPT
jgi:hypothetical protein